MKRCPKCRCGAEFVNSVGYYASQAGATSIGVVGGLLFSVVNPNMGGPVANEIRKNMTKNVHKQYKCTNPSCMYCWSE